MTNWFIVNATPIISACSALIGVALTGLISFYVNKANARSNREARESQNDFEKWKTNREFYINKAEELFTLFDKWHENAYQIYVLTVARATDTKSSEEVRDEWNNHTDKTIQPRINALLTLYYPELVSVFSEITDTYSKIMTGYAMYIAQKTDASEFIIPALDHIEFIRVNGATFKEKLALLTQKHL